MFPLSILYYFIWGRGSPSGESLIRVFCHLKWDIFEGKWDLSGYLELNFKPFITIVWLDFSNEMGFGAKILGFKNFSLA